MSERTFFVSTQHRKMYVKTYEGFHVKICRKTLLSLTQYFDIFDYDVQNILLFLHYHND